MLSPLLFNIFIADLGKSLDENGGIPLGDTMVSSMLFADDLMILGIQF